MPGSGGVAPSYLVRVRVRRKGLGVRGEVLGARVRHWGEGEALAPEALLELGEVPLVPGQG